ncbi:toxin [Seongchinamella sediminis]|uniref:Toxin n=1 Tax=Seongchinamella sediminis TaxID=2283635 RepID=A0A3L7DUQ9_9GAMM|nr:toxin [Seongchinamella sediminis]RLQ20856.1 toxin [Seongchinamella sediminis]
MKVFNWNSEKNRQLIEERGRSFEEAIFHIENGRLLDDICHPNAKDYPRQKIFVVAIDQYAYLVPYVESDDEIFLKTMMPSGKFTKLYLRGDS